MEQDDDFVVPELAEADGALSDGSELIDVHTVPLTHSWPVPYLGAIYDDEDAISMPATPRALAPSPSRDEYTVFGACALGEMCVQLPADRQNAMHIACLRRHLHGAPNPTRAFLVPSERYGWLMPLDIPRELITGARVPRPVAWVREAAASSSSSNQPGTRHRQRRRQR